MGLYCDVHNIKSVLDNYNKYPVICCLDFKKAKKYFNKFIVINLGLELSERLSMIGIENRNSVVIDELDKIITEKKKEKFLINNIDMLFNPEYNFDILRYFINLSRTKKIVVLWSGRYDVPI